MTQEIKPEFRGNETAVVLGRPKGDRAYIGASAVIDDIPTVLMVSRKLVFKVPNARPHRERQDFLFEIPELSEEGVNAVRICVDRLQGKDGAYSFTRAEVLEVLSA